MSAAARRARAAAEPSPAAEHGSAQEYGSVEEYAEALAAALRGPARAKARMVAEMRDGLADTVAACADAGLPPDRALERAVREFGTVAELAPACQRELTVAQVRHTSRAVTLTTPVLAVCWYLLLTAAHGTGRAPSAAQWLAAPFAGAATVAALLAAVALAVTGPLARRLPTPRRLPLAVAWAGTVAGVSMALATLTLAAASPLAAHGPPAALAGALTVVSHVAVASSSRTCRACARA